MFLSSKFVVSFIIQNVLWSTVGRGTVVCTGHKVAFETKTLVLDTWFLHSFEMYEIIDFSRLYSLLH